MSRHGWLPSSSDHDVQTSEATVVGPDFLELHGNPEPCPRGSSLLSFAQLLVAGQNARMSAPETGSELEDAQDDTSLRTCART